MGGWGLSFRLAFATSIFSGGFGIARFLKAGPCKMIPSNSGFLDGFVGLGLPAVVLSVLATLLGKGILLPVMAEDDRRELSFAKAVMWLGINLVPSMIYVSQYALLS